MAANGERPPVRIRFQFNVETGEIEEFLIDDAAPANSEDYHDKVAGAVAAPLARHPLIEDAGPVRHARPGPLPVSSKDQDQKGTKQSDKDDEAVPQ